MAGNPDENDVSDLPGGTGGGDAASTGGYAGSIGGDAGSTESGDAGGAQLGDSGAKSGSAKKPLAKSFNCGNCGGAVTLRFPGASLTVICPNCHSVIDALDENLAVLTKYYKKTSTYQPVLALGSRGKLKDKLWEVIGYMVRSDVRSGYSWEEYLLFNPYYGYRWLVEDRGHWNFVTMIKRKPEQAHSATCIMDSKVYRIFNSGQTRVDYVIGEFYWRVVMASEVTTADYIDPPFMLSMEKSFQDVVWSMGEYIPSNEIKKAFKPEKGMPQPYGVGAIEPSPTKESWNKVAFLFMLFWGIITCAQVYFWRSAADADVFTYNQAFEPNTKKADLTTPTFTLSGDSANVEISSAASVDNSWFWWAGELVNDDTGAPVPLEQTVEYYHGYDSDGYWSEGGTPSKILISSVPGGKYYINLDYESGDFKTTGLQHFDMRIKRDVPTLDNYLWLTFFLSIIPIFTGIAMRRTEVSRWSNSDFSPYGGYSSYTGSSYSSSSGSNY